MKLSALLLVLVAALAAPACKGKSEPNEGKNMPRLAPPPDVDLPADLAIGVTVDGAARPTIDAAKLRATPPDFADSERRAWRVGTLVPEAATAARVLASGSHDVAVALEPRTAEGLIAVIMVSRRGDVGAAMVEEKEPFPTYHGQGGRLGRPGDPLPRVIKLQKLEVLTK
jgi:hypothetical protein